MAITPLSSSSSLLEVGGTICLERTISTQYLLDLEEGQIPGLRGPSSLTIFMSKWDHRSTEDLQRARKRKEEPSPQLSKSSTQVNLFNALSTVNKTKQNLDFGISARRLSESESKSKASTRLSLGLPLPRPNRTHRTRHRRLSRVTFRAEEGKREPC